MFGRSNQSLLNDDFQLVVKLILTLTSEGARAPSSKLIVGCDNSEISFHFCKDCRIFREGVKDSSIGIISNNGIDGRTMAFGRLLLAVGLIMPSGCKLAFGHIMAFGRNLAFGRIMAFGRNMAFGRIMAFSRNCNELIELIMAFGLNELIELNDVGPIKLIVKYHIGLIVRIIGLVGHIGLCVLNGSSTLAGCWIIDLIGHICLVSHIRLVGDNGLVGIIDHNGLTDLVSPNSLVGFSYFVNLISLSGQGTP